MPADSSHRVLVTGAAGFLGRAVVGRLLDAGWRVEAAAHRGTPEDAEAHPQLRWHEADLLDGSAVERLVEDAGAAHLMHFAWAPGRGIYDSPENFRWVQASMELLKRFLEGGGRRALFAGSSAEYDWSEGVCRERSTRLAGGGAYGASKRGLGELFQGLCESYAQRGDGDVSGAWARIFFLFGQHEPEARLIPAVARGALEGGSIKCSEGTQIRDYLFVEDAADALVRVLESDITGPINVGSGEGIRLRDLVRELTDLAGGDATDRIEWGTAGHGPGEAPLVIADTRRLSEELDWQPPVGRTEGLVRSLAWWRERLLARAEA